MVKTKTKRWDAADYLKTNRDATAYLEAALEDGDSAVVAAALGDIARARGMTRIARQAGLGRESLYKALSADGNPELETVLRVIHALGIRLHAAQVAVHRLRDQEDPVVSSAEMRKRIARRKG